jgi:hypothetical protein
VRAVSVVVDFGAGDPRLDLLGAKFKILFCEKNG